ncbi:MAG TPA: AraC family transcriptional regulator [Cyclobacteriaceae bacterium]|nr:AraC family transcriptional regulator [Cyclobacteriaceae bacterium]
MPSIPIRQIKPTASEPKISQTFRIRDIEVVLNGKEMAQELHRHDFFFVLALEKGKGKHVIDFVPFDVGNNCIFMMRPGQVHELFLKAGCSGYLLEFNAEFYHVNDRGTSHSLRSATKTNLCKVDKGSFGRLRTVLANIFEEYRDQKTGYDEVIRAQLDIFFIELIRNRQQSSPPSTAETLYDQERLEEFLQLVETNASTKKQVADYEDMLNMSNYQLSALTKRVLGKTPSELINDYIILESKRQLLATSSQVNQIAWHLGFEDPSYFIRFFKKHTGFSPEAFRSKSK